MLIMVTENGFYPIKASGIKSIEKEAKDHGELNSHIMRVEDTEGKVLWSRIN